MPSPTRSLTIAAARDLIEDLSFPSRSEKRVGVEIEWFTTPSDSPPDVPSLHSYLDPLLPLPHGSALTFEPGGQVELSSRPYAACSDACAAVASDARLVRDELRRNGVEVFAAGNDPERSLRLLTTESRYVSMRAYWDQAGEAGARMMCTTAAVHVNVDAGRDEAGARRWRTAHRLGPVLTAAFANSPLVDGRPSGWKSARMASWMAIDPTRTAPVDTAKDPWHAWADYALAANVMLIRTPEGYVPILEPLPFARWIDEGHELGCPTADDLAYHLTTLFPPVRPHMWLELRMIDMVPDPWWRAAVALVTALLYDDEAARRADEALAPAQGLWDEAARSALEHPALGEAARACFEAGVAATGATGCDPETVDALSEYAERYVYAGRCPADDRLEQPAEPKTETAEAI